MLRAPGAGGISDRAPRALVAAAARAADSCEATIDVGAVDAGAYAEDGVRAVRHVVTAETAASAKAARATGLVTPARESRRMPGPYLELRASGKARRRSALLGHPAPLL
ncbi:MAG TPA: hypothetical protein VF989_15710 [Polyangiaceae bacterium]